MPTPFPTIDNAGSDTAEMNTESDTEVNVGLIFGIIGGIIGLVLIVSWVHYSLASEKVFIQEEVVVQSHRDIENRTVPVPVAVSLPVATIIQDLKVPHVEHVEAGNTNRVYALDEVPPPAYSYALMTPGYKGSLV